jgi:hypothetical protein
MTELGLLLILQINHSMDFVNRYTIYRAEKCPAKIDGAFFTNAFWSEI